MKAISTRPIIERMAFIRAQLVGCKLFTCKSVAAHFEVSPKTIHRDIEFMRDRLGYQMEFNSIVNSWTGTAPDPAIL